MNIPFDQREGTIWMDGEYKEWKEAKTHVLNHGLHYASSVFEGIRAYDGKVFKMKEHYDRLLHSAELLDFTIPYTTEEMSDVTMELLQRMNVKDAYIRPVAWRGSEMMAISAQKTSTHLAIAVWQWPNYHPKETLEKGLKLVTSDWKRPAPDTAPTASKAAGLYMICTISKHAAERDGYHDALMLDYRGYVAELTGANIFLVQDGEIHTPTPDCFLDGITRRTAIDLAKKRQLKVIERHIKPVEFAHTQEVFITGTAAEIKPVGAIDDYQFTVGPVTKGLIEDYTALVRA